MKSFRHYSYLRLMYTQIRRFIPSHLPYIYFNSSKTRKSLLSAHQHFVTNPVSPLFFSCPSVFSLRVPLITLSHISTPLQNHPHHVFKVMSPNPLTTTCLVPYIVIGKRAKTKVIKGPFSLTVCSNSSPGKLFFQLLFPPFSFHHSPVIE